MEIERSFSSDDELHEALVEMVPRVLKRIEECRSLLLQAWERELWAKRGFHSWAEYVESLGITKRYSYKLLNKARGELPPPKPVTSSPLPDTSVNSAHGHSPLVEMSTGSDDFQTAIQRLQAFIPHGPQGMATRRDSFLSLTDERWVLKLKDIADDLQRGVEAWYQQRP